MGVQQRHFLLLVTLAAAAATPALGQPVTPAVGPASSATQSAATIPDLSGMWGHQSLPGLEPPASGPGPVVNRSRTRQLFSADGRLLPAGNAPLVSNTLQLVGDYTNPILKPQAAEVVKKHGEISLSGVAYPTPTNQCRPAGVPYILWNFGIEILQQPDKITILYLFDHEVRHIRLNEPHPAHVTRPGMGIPSVITKATCW
jgi:hypothetical protein